MTAPQGAAASTTTPGRTTLGAATLAIALAGAAAAWPGAHPPLLTNGKASLGLAGKGDGYDLGAAVAALTIRSK